MFLNDTTTGGFPLYNGAFEYLSPNTGQDVRFSPTGALFRFEGGIATTAAESKLGPGSQPGTALFSFSKPFADGTAPCNLGCVLGCPIHVWPLRP